MKKITLLSLALAVMLVRCGSSEEPQNDTPTSDQPTATQEQSDTSAPADPVVDTVSPPDSIIGFDVSHFQGSVNWEDAKNSNKVFFGYAKATQGIDYVDPEFAKNQTNAAAAGIPFGAYHFFMADDNVIEQIENFASVYKPGKGNNLPPVLDVEGGGVPASFNVSTYQKSVLNWLHEFESRYAVRPIIYTNKPFADEYLSDPEFATYHLWIADYNNQSAPDLPTTWSEKGYLMWQYTDKGSVSGVQSDHVDHDLFHGTWEEFQALLK